EKAAMADSLDAERARLDAEINQTEIALNNYRLKRDHLESLRKERERLTGALEKNRAEIAKLEPMASVAARLAEVETGQQRRTEELARLRAEVARDEEMIRALDRGRVGPLLPEKCLNLKPGESLDSRFRAGLDARRVEIANLQSALTALVEEVKQSRAAALETSRLSHFQSDSARLAEELESKRNQITAIEEEISQAANLSEPEIRRLKVRRTELEAELRQSREAERIYGQAELLRSEIAQVAREGEAKKQERDEVSQRIEKLGDVETRLAEAEAELQSLNDPRGRAAALNQVVAREGELKRNLEDAEGRVAQVNANLEQANLEMRAYATLDGEIAAAGQTRAESERDYQAFIANEKIAATLTAREQELAALEADIEGVNVALASALESLNGFEGRYDSERHHQALSELDRLRDRVTQLTSQIGHAGEEHSRLRNQLMRLEEARARAREQIAERERSERLRVTSDFI